MTDPSLQELAELARSLGLSWSQDRLEAVLPEVQRVRGHARRLRELLARADEPLTRFHPK